MSLGPVMIDLEGTGITPLERDLLRHPAAGGVILFTRNYESPGQLAALVAEIHGLREPKLIVGVDHEGGRVQRFHDGFTRLPPAAALGRWYDRDREAALAAAAALGFVMASELRAVGVDVSFAPVLDLNHGVSGVIGDRAFHRSADAVARLAQAVMRGMREGGMAAVGKHFPGHGAVREDSHLTLPVDPRPLEDILVEDLLPFERMIGYGLAGVMPAHIVYERVDPRPAGFSTFWLGEILRGRLRFQGVVFSDDLSMAGAAVAGDLDDRAHAALSAGCDMVLVCNHPEGAGRVLESLQGRVDPAAQLRLARLHGRPAPDRAALATEPRWREAVARLEPLAGPGDLELDV